MATSADSTEDELQKRFDRMTFVVATKNLHSCRNGSRYRRLQDDNDAAFSSGQESKGSTTPSREYSQRLARLRAIRKYVYRMDVLERTLSYDEVTEIFVRVNSLGAKLRGSDLALAQITAKWRNSLKIFDAFQKKCAGLGFELDLGLYLKNLIAFATDQSRFLTVGRLRVERLQKSWKESCAGMEFALNFMKNNVGIDSPALLSSPFLLITLGYYGHKREYSFKPEESRRLRYWILIANAKGRYSRGSSESLLDQDLATLRDGGGAQELIDGFGSRLGAWKSRPRNSKAATGAVRSSRQCFWLSERQEPRIGDQL